MASIEVEEAEERRRMQAERAAEGRDPNEDTNQYRGESDRSVAYMRPPTNEGDINNGPGTDNSPGPGNPGPGPGGGNGGGGTNGGGGGGGVDLRAKANALLAKYGIKDPGNLDSLLSGRANWDEYVKDTVSRANNYTGDRPFDSQGPMYDQATNQLNAAGRAALAARSIVPPNDPRTRTTAPPFNNGTSNPQQTNLWGNQFNDPYTVQLEDLIKSQLEQLQKPIQDPNRDQLAQLLNQSLQRNQNNPQMDKLMAFLDQQFKTRSETPGYTQDERALMNTQAFEPIEALRNASRQRELERTSQAGYLPTSGIADERMTNSDRYYDQLRTVANRDLSIKNIDQSRADQQEALGLGRLGVQLPQQQDAQGIDIASLLAQLSQGSRTEDQSRQGQAVNLATQLYQLPINAQNQALNVINGTGNPSQGINSLIQLQQLQNQQRAYSDAANADIYRAIGEYLGQFLN